MSQWYCPLPFRHAFIDSTGLSFCCQTPRQNTTLDQWQQNPALIDVQQKLLHGPKPQVCSSCVQQETHYGTSLRTQSLADYGYGTFTTTKIDFIDFRSYNICNFKCRSCHPTFSHGINQENRIHPRLQEFFGEPLPEKTASVSDQNVEWIMQNLRSLKRIMFTGGEPTVIPAVRTLIEKIIDEDIDIHVIITTNASFKDSFWFDITRRLKKIHWTVSIDSVGSPASIVRHGTDWPVIEHNVTWLARNAPSLDINSVVSNLTVFGLKPLLQFGRKIQQLSRTPSGCRHQFHVCQRPYYLAADNWPAELHTQAMDYVESCLELDLCDEQRNMVTGLSKQLRSAEFDPVLWERSEIYNRELDQIRDENHLELFKPQA